MARKPSPKTIEYRIRNQLGNLTRRYKSGHSFDAIETMLEAAGENTALREDIILTYVQALPAFADINRIGTRKTDVEPHEMLLAEGIRILYAEAEKDKTLIRAINKSVMSVMGRFTRPAALQHILNSMLEGKYVDDSMDVDSNEKIDKVLFTPVITPFFARAAAIQNPHDYFPRLPEVWFLPKSGREGKTTVIAVDERYAYHWKLYPIKKYKPVSRMDPIDRAVYREKIINHANVASRVFSGEMTPEQAASRIRRFDGTQYLALIP